MKHILIVDDDATTRIFLRSQVEALGYEAVVCADAAEVLAIRDAQKLPDLLLVDWNMPGVSGIELIQMLKVAPASLPYVIMITSRSDRNDLLAALRAGADDYLLKPAEPQELAARVTIAKHQLAARRAFEQQRAYLSSSTKLRAIGEMAGGIAHEINNPLAVITGHTMMVETALGKTPIDVSQAKDSLKRISAAAFRASKIIRGLLLFAREGDNGPFAKDDLKVTVERALELCRARFTANGVTVRAPAFDETPWVMVHQRSNVIQTILALLENAFLAARTTEKPWMELTAEFDDERFTLRVTDGGRGVPAENRDKIMLPFFTTRPVGQGAGLGLAVALGIAESHGGQLMLDTQHPQTSFVLTLPRAPA